MVNLRLERCIKVFNVNYNDDAIQGTTPDSDIKTEQTRPFNRKSNQGNN